MKCIIIGSPGSGKSWLGRLLSEKTNIPLYPLDLYYWNAGWQPTEREEWIKKQQEMIAGENWIIEGNYKSTLDLRIAAADTIIFLDMPRLLCIWRIICRRNKKRPDLPEGLREPFDREFFEFLKLAWDFPKTERQSIIQKLSCQPSAGKNILHIIHIRTKKQLKNYIAQLSSSADLPNRFSN
ncbi:MAG: hypothetical protein E7332_08910 [Clostridiales bacterium]|nr:hypothetical protein [Clostridiales bacterium]